MNTYLKNALFEKLLSVLKQKSKSDQWFFCLVIKMVLTLSKIKF